MVSEQVVDLDDDADHVVTTRGGYLAVRRQVVSEQVGGGDVQLLDGIAGLHVQEAELVDRRGFAHSQGEERAREAGGGGEARVAEQGMP